MNEARPQDGVITCHATLLLTGKTSTGIRVAADVVATLR